MKVQFDNLVISSFALFLQNKILDKGESYYNTSATFFPINAPVNGKYYYAAPFEPIVSDFSISGAIIPTGIYINSNFITTGTSGFLGYNYDKGQAIFSNKINGNITGYFSVAEYSIQLTIDSDEKLLFEKKYLPRPKISQNLTGLQWDEATYPTIFVKIDGSNNEAFAIGGLDETTLYVKAMIATNSQFHLDATSSILRDLKYTSVPLIKEIETPFNRYGIPISGIYNYSNLTSNKGVELFIDDVYITKFDSAIKTELSKLNPEVFFAIAEFTLVSHRYPRINT